MRWWTPSSIPARTSRVALPPPSRHPPHTSLSLPRATLPTPPRREAHQQGGVHREEPQQAGAHRRLQGVPRGCLSSGWAAALPSAGDVRGVVDGTSADEGPAYCGVRKFTGVWGSAVCRMWLFLVFAVWHADLWHADLRRHADLRVGMQRPLSAGTVLNCVYGGHL